MNTHQNKNRKPSETRSFGGKIKDFDSKKEQRREQKHLKAHLKGHDQFQDGFIIEVNPITNLKQKVPNFIKVKTKTF